jgi:hypothetical protein
VSCVAHAAERNRIANECLAPRAILLRAAAVDDGRDKGQSTGKRSDGAMLCNDVGGPDFSRGLAEASGHLRWAVAAQEQLELGIRQEEVAGTLDYQLSEAGSRRSVA